jgi:hypothetical protein
MRFQTNYLLLTVALFVAGSSFGEGTFKAGFAQVDVTPPKATPMWGYGDRHALLSRGTRDPLYAKALVLETDSGRLVLVGLDLGRSPGSPDFDRILDAVQKKVGDDTFIMMSGSHTHHGPVLELKDEPGKGKGVFDDAVKYRKSLEKKLIDVIVEAAKETEDAQIGWSSKHVDMNRNRHTKLEPKPKDTELSVVRVDDTAGNPIAVMVNFTAHPTMLDAADLRFSAEYPGVMMNEVEAAMNTHCFFMQGAAGDMSVQTNAEDNPKDDDASLLKENLSEDDRAFIMEVRKVDEVEALKMQQDMKNRELRMMNFGKRLGTEVIELAKATTTSVPATPKVQGLYKNYEFVSRVNFKSKFVQGMFKTAFFPELANASLDDVADNYIKSRLSVALLNGELALVGGSGEFFCDHSIGLKDRSLAAKTLFLGYCNGHQMYFPTIKGASQGGYGASPEVSWVEVGAGEQMIDDALYSIYDFMGKWKGEPMGGAPQ